MSASQGELIMSTLTGIIAALSQGADTMMSESPQEEGSTRSVILTFEDNLQSQRPSTAPG